MRNILSQSGKVWGVTAIALAMLVAQARQTLACPFCSAVSLTFAQEIAQSQAAAIVRLVEPPPAGALSPRAEGPLPKGKFAVVEVLKGGDLSGKRGALLTLRLAELVDRALDELLLRHHRSFLLFLMMRVSVRYK
jgi:hypothetical protein